MMEKRRYKKLFQKFDEETSVLMAGAIGCTDFAGETEFATEFKQLLKRVVKTVGVPQDLHEKVLTKLKFT